MKLHRNPLLEEIWEIKDRLAAEAGNDMHVFCEQLRAWSAAHPHSGPVAKSPAELRALLAKKEEAESLALRENPPEYGEKKEWGGMKFELKDSQTTSSGSVLAPHDGTRPATWAMGMGGTS